jgi:hypothetical protein
MKAEAQQPIESDINRLELFARDQHGRMQPRAGTASENAAYSFAESVMIANGNRSAKFNFRN